MARETGRASPRAQEEKRRNAGKRTHRASPGCPGEGDGARREKRREHRGRKELQGKWTEPKGRGRQANRVRAEKQGKPVGNQNRHDPPKPTQRNGTEPGDRRSRPAAREEERQGKRWLTGAKERAKRTNRPREPPAPKERKKEPRQVLRREEGAPCPGRGAREERRERTMDRDGPDGRGGARTPWRAGATGRAAGGGRGEVPAVWARRRTLTRKRSQEPAAGGGGAERPWTKMARSEGKTQPSQSEQGPQERVHF